MCSFGCITRSQNSKRIPVDTHLCSFLLCPDGDFFRVPSRLQQLGIIKTLYILVANDKTNKQINYIYKQYRNIPVTADICCVNASKQIQQHCVLSYYKTKRNQYKHDAHDAGEKQRQHRFYGVCRQRPLYCQFKYRGVGCITQYFIGLPLLRPVAV